MITKSRLQPVGGRMVQYTLQLSERWPCHIWLVGRMKYASIEANLGGGWGLLAGLQIRVHN